MRKGCEYQVMTELKKQMIHMNRQKGSTVSQITLDDDFIVPDTMDDVTQILMERGEIQIESARPQGERMLIRGKLMFYLLYQKAGGGLQALGGEIPFDEVVNVPGLTDHDDTRTAWTLEDLSIGMINSRKLSIKAVVALTVQVESLYDAEVSVDVETDDAGMQVLKRTIEVAAIAARRKDTYRIREDLQISGNKPNIEGLLWDEMRLRSVTVRAMNGAVHMDGELMVFLIYSGEGEHTPTQWLEESIPFSGEVELAEAGEDMIPAVGVRILQCSIEGKPDYDGEMREFSVDAVLELDIRLYREETVELLSDLYSTGCELTVRMGEACFNRLLTRNVCRTKVNEQIRLQKQERVLQLIHSSGMVKLDDISAAENGLLLEGVLEVTLLYLTDEDEEPIRSAKAVLPFRFTAEADGITEDSVWQVNPGLEQLTAVMLGGDQVEIKAVITADVLVLLPVREPVVEEVTTAPLDQKKLQELPGIVGYVVQPGDSLWKIAKKFHTTVDNIKETNSLTGEESKPGERLILMKEIW